MLVHFVFSFGSSSLQLMGSVLLPHVLFLLITSQSMSTGEFAWKKVVKTGIVCEHINNMGEKISSLIVFVTKTCKII